jgi:hypothetical protein
MAFVGFSNRVDTMVFAAASGSRGGSAPRVVGIDVQRIIGEFRAKRTSSYLKMIEDPILREHVQGMAEAAYEARKPGIPLEQFTEEMALNWLAKMKVFEQLVEAGGFTTREKIELKENGAIIAITQGGSIIAATEKKEGFRSIYYGRIELSPEAPIPPFQAGRLIPPAIGVRLIFEATSQKMTSRVTALAYKERADRGELEDIIRAINVRYQEVDGLTINKAR